MDAFKERVIRNSLRPPAVPGIGRTEKYGSRLFDPSVRLAADIRDNEGRVFARQGEVMNPLQYVPFNQTLYFINGDDPAQVALDETPDAAHTGEQNYPRAGAVSRRCRKRWTAVFTLTRTVCSASASALIRSRHG